MRHGPLPYGVAVRAEAIVGQGQVAPTRFRSFLACFKAVESRRRVVEERVALFTIEIRHEPLHRVQANTIRVADFIGRKVAGEHTAFHAKKLDARTDPRMPSVRKLGG